MSTGRLLYPILGSLLLLTPLATFGEEEESDAAEILAELTEALELTEEQVPEVAAALEGFVTEMEAATAQAEDEEPDTQKIIGDIKSARDGFQKNMERTLTKEQNEKFQAMVDAVFQETFEDVAEIRLIDLKPVLELTDEQYEALIPVMGTGIRNVVGVLFEYGDKKMKTRTKIKLGKNLKAIQAEVKAGMEEILTPEQMEKYEAYKEAQKEAKEG